MKVSTKWLNDYVKVDDLDPLALSEKIERTAVEVDDTYKMQDGLKKIVVGHVLETKAHPDSDHLHICQVDIGEEEPSQIVCGAPNVAAGQKVIVALPNSRIADNVKIKKSKMRGVVSEGMICALQEIGFSETIAPKAYAEGIYVLPEDAKPGDPVYPYLGMDEDIIDVDITPNRGDMLSMRGVAYEVGAIYDRKVTLNHPEVKEASDEKIEDYVSIEAPEELVAPYLMRIIKDVEIKDSPLWLQKRLWNAGIRPINNVVDVTNYILLDYGQPLHSFDYDKLGSKKIVVRLAEEGEKMTTLDGEERELKANDIVVTNGEVPVALAGTMGGLDSEVVPETTTIALESAVFNGHNIRKTSRRENLHSEASMRFERGINKATVAEALDAAAQMIAELGNGHVVSGVAKANDKKAEAKEVKITLKKINKVLGTSLTEQEVEDIFRRLGFGTAFSEDTFTVSVPPRRWDIEIDADLLEEVARIYGYDNLPTTLPQGPTTPGHYTYKQKVIRQTRRLLEGAGLTQAISYGLTTAEKSRRFAMEPAETTELAFPMTSDRTTARMNLVSGLLDDVAYNAARKVENVSLYEQGRVFLRDKDNDRPREVEHVAGALTGLFRKSTWHDDKLAAGFYLAKGIVDFLLNSLAVSGRIEYRATSSHEAMHPGRTADIYLDDDFIGYVGEVHPSVAKEYRLKRVYVFELNLQKIIDAPKKESIYEPVSKYPTVSRDIALVVPIEVTNQQIVDCIKKNGGAYLKDIRLFDVYKGENIGKGFRSLAYTLQFSNSKQTLQDEEVSRPFDKIKNKLKEEFNAVIR